MAKKITFRLTGETERFFEYMEEQGLTARDVVARALWLFEKAWKTCHVAIVDDKFQIEYIYTAQPLADVAEQSIKSHEGLTAVVGQEDVVTETAYGAIGAIREEINRQQKESSAVEERMKKQGGSSQGDLKTEREGQ
jgi:hypothetical protein